MTEEIIDKFKKYGLADHVIAAIMGNIDVETGGTFDPFIKQKGGNGYGLFQFDWWKPRYEKWVASNKKEDNASTQVDFFLDTLYGKGQKDLGYGVAQEIKKSFDEGDTASIAKTLSDKWFKPGKPHLDRRVQSALAFENKLNPENTQPTQPTQSIPSPTPVAASNASFENALLGNGGLFVNPLLAAT